MRESLNVAVAIGTAKSAVNRGLERCVVYVQTDLFAILVFGQSCIIVTGQTLLVAHLGGGLGLGRRPGKRSE